MPEITIQHDANERVIGLGASAEEAARQKELARAEADRAAASAASASTSAAKLTPFESAPAAGSNPEALQWLKYKTKDSEGDPVAVPASLELRELQIYNSNQFRLRFGTPGGGQVAREKGNGTYLTLASTTGKLLVDIIEDSGDNGALNTVIAQAYVDLDLITPANYSAANLAVPVDLLKVSRNPTEAENTGEQIADSLEAERAMGTRAFVATVRSAVLREMFCDPWFYGVDQAQTLGVYKLAYYPNGLRPYIDIVVRDFASATDVVSRRFTKASDASSTGAAKAEFVAELEAQFPRIALTGENNGNSNIEGHFAMDWSPLVDLAYGDHVFATHDECGFHPDRLLDDGDVADYLDRDHYHEEATVGASGSDYATLRAAAAAYLQPNTAGTGNPVSEQAHYHHRVRLRVKDGTFAATNLDVAPFLEIAGAGMGRTIVTPENGTAFAMFEGHDETKVFDLTIRSSTNPEYAWHSDASNKRSFTPAGKQNRRRRQKFERVEFLCVDGNVGQAFGCGVSSGEIIRFLSCPAGHQETVLPGTLPAAFFFHNNGPTASVPTTPVSLLPGRVEMINCSVSDDFKQAVVIQTITAGARCTLDVRGGSRFASIWHDITGGNTVEADLARDRHVWTVTGVHEGAFNVRDLDGSIVLSVPTGTTVAGALAAELFGAVDEHGRGEKWVRDTSAYSLGARLGNRTGNTDSLTLNGVSWTPTTDLTAASNATILADIQTATGVAITTEDIAREFYPDMGFTRRMRNSTGATIPKGRLVTRTARGVVALAQPGDRVFGWTTRAILNGDDGNIVTARMAWFEYLAGASENGGEWGVGVDGVVDHAAAVKIGTCLGGLLERW